MPENQNLNEEIHTICDQLTINRERRGPYTVKWQSGGLERELTVDSTRFRFHERGDVENQVNKRQALIGAREHNWQEATMVWRELLNVQNLHTTNALAPHQTKIKLIQILRQDLLLIIVCFSLILLGEGVNQRTIVGVSFALSFPLIKISMHRVCISIILVGAYGLLNNQVEYLFVSLTLILLLEMRDLLSSELLIYLFPVLIGIVLFFSKETALIVLIMMLFEIISDLANKSVSRLLSDSVAFLVSIVFLTVEGSPQFDLSAIGLITAMTGMVLSILAFPYSSDRGMIRVSLPFAVGIMALFAESDPSIAAGMLGSWFILLLWSTRQKISKTEAPIFTTGTPVKLSAKRISEQP
jgi:hypothetical protein